MIYKVYTNYGYTDETEQFSSPSLHQAEEWARGFVYHNGDTAGCLMVEVAYHAPDGEYHTVKRYDLSEEDER